LAGDISRETAADVSADVREEAETGGDYQEFAEKQPALKRTKWA